MFKPTPEQQRLIEVIQAKELKAIGIEAGPGCGKSSTLVLLSSHITDKGQMTCFGADIRKDLNQKLKDSKFDAKTFNSIGWSTIRKELEKRLGYQPTFEQMKTDEAKYLKLADKAIGGDFYADYTIPALLIPDSIKFDAMRFIERLAYFCMVTMSDNTDVKALVQLITLYEFEPRLDIEDDTQALIYEEEIKNWGLDNVESFMQLGENEIETNLNMTFTDQVYYTVKWNLRPWQTPYLFIDEGQDISEMELRLLSKCVRRNGYVVIVYDHHQAIFKFKGSLPIQNVISYFGAKVYPLSATFRCPRRIVRLANMVKPTLQASFDREGAIGLQSPDNIVDIVKAHKDEGDIAIIARTNAPLIRLCLELIVSDIPATVIGSDIGRDLNKTLDKIADIKGYSFETLLDSLATYRKTHVARMTDRMTDDNEIKAFTDTLDALKAIIERHTDTLHPTPAKSLDDLKTRINDLFTDAKDANGDIIKLMTAHKSKGMEFDTVLLVNDFRVSMKPGEKRITAIPIDETYVWFVAVTRTKNRLIVLDNKKPDWLVGHLEGDPGYDLPPFTPPSEAPQPDPIEETDDLGTEPEAPEPEPVNVDDVEEEPARTLTRQGESAKAWAQQLLKDKNFVVLDTETTDLDGEIIQLAVSDADGNALINTLIKPVKHSISPDAQAIHGISEADVKDAPTFADIAHTLVEVIRDKIVICYNVNFDRARVQDSTKANSLPLLNHLPASWQCAMHRYVAYNPDKPHPWKTGERGGWWKLQEALEQESIDTTNVDFHDAMADVRATLAVMQSMAGLPITAFDGKNEPLPIEKQTGTFAIGEPVQIIVTRRTGTVQAYLPPDQYSVQVDKLTPDDKDDRVSTYSDNQLRSLYAYDTPIGPEVESAKKNGDRFKKGDAVHIKPVDKRGEVFAVMNDAVSVRVNGKYMVYAPKDLSLITDIVVSNGDRPDPQPVKVETPANVTPLPIKRRIPSRVRTQVKTMLKDAELDHLLEMRALIDEMIETKQKAEVQ